MYTHLKVATKVASWKSWSTMSRIFVTDFLVFSLEVGVLPMVPLSTSTHRISKVVSRFFLLMGEVGVSPDLVSLRTRADLNLSKLWWPRVLPTMWTQTESKQD